MRSLSTPLLVLLAFGCSSSSDNNSSDTNSLIGIWKSNCHEFLGTEDESGNNRYNISEITFNETEYVDRFVSYTDINCINDPVVESSTFNYTVGDNVATSDGVEATRITLTSVFPDRPELAVTVEAIFRINGIDLNFGEYTEGEVPSINTSVIYTRQ